ncbi:choice-of-anchor X domain-containing protein, partial [Candidatus Poribacteria bacterium]
MLFKCPLRAKSVGRGIAGKSPFFLLFLIGLLSFTPLLPVMAAPDTVIIAGPTGSLTTNDLAFWWTGKTTTPDTYINGFYYRLDNEPWNWTRERVIAYYGLPDGSHRLDVKAVDSENAEDPSPASRSFSVHQSSAVEPDESPFGVDLELLEFEIDLDNGKILAGLRRKFRDEEGIILSQNALVQAREPGSRWLITDGNKNYTARREGDDLSIYEGDALFSISSNFGNELDDGTISEDLKDEFDDEDITLSSDASVQIQESGSRWKITDGGTTYTIRKEGNRLNVYKNETHLFSIGRVEYTTSNLDNGDVPGSLRQEFGSNGIALSQSAVSESGSDSSEWLITDVDEIYIVRKSGNDLSIYQSVNDESSEATLLTPGVAIECLNQPDSDDNNGVDEDWFRVTVAGQSAPRQLAVLFRRPDSIGSTTIEVYRHPKLNQKLADFQAEDEALFATGITAGDYLIHIIPDGEDTTAPYFLTVTADSLTSGIIWDAERNDSFVDATETPSISLSRSTPWVEMVGNKWSGSDSRDWFKIYIDAPLPTRLSLNLTRPQSGETKVILHPSSPSSVIGKFTVTSASNPRWKLQTGVESGEYLLEVDLAGHDDSTYFLTLQTSDFPAGEVWEQEPNDSSDFANQLPFGVRIRGTKGHSADIRDWFRFTAPNDGIFNLTTSRILGVGAVNIYLLDPVLMNPVGGPLAFEVQEEQQRDWLNLDLLAGDYLVEVDLTKLAGDYWLTAMFVTSLQHDAPADDALVVGDVLTVEMVWVPGNTAAFDVSTIDGNLNDQPIPMYDDGLHGDGSSNDGVYVGTYIIQGIEDEEVDDHITDAMVIAHLQDQSGNTANIPVGDEFIIDTTPPDDLPPEILEVRHNAADALRTGQKLTVTIEGEAGNTATFDIGEYRRGLPAFDDGKHNDSGADDGIYVGEYTVLAEDSVADAVITGHLVDDFGNAASLDALILVDIVGDRPVISFVDHNARLTLGQGDTLEVTMIGDPDGIASFDIAGLVSNVPMYDDGQHNDGDRGDGRYVGFYEVVEGDGVLGATVTAHLLDRRGRKTTKTSQLNVNIDAVAPVPIVGVEIQDRPNDQGGFLALSWNASTELDFSYYNVYLSQDTPIPVSAGRVVGLLPVNSDITDPARTSVDLEVESDLTDYFAAVTAVDIMGNESLLDVDGNSIAGPAQALDNLKPTPVRKVEAIDKDQDFGGVIILSWTDVNQDEDFARYNIYQETNPILSTDGLRPVDSIADRYVTVLDIYVSDADRMSALPGDHYFAVTAVDLSGNESELDEFGDSVAGPVRAVNNIGVEPDAPVKFLSGPVGTVHHNHAAFHWSRFGSDPHTGYYFRLDDANWQWTTDSTAFYHDLSPGQHSFSIRTGALSEDAGISRSFTVVPVSTSEREPNDSQDMAYGIRAGMIIRGDNAGGDDDWFRIHVPLADPSVMDILLSRPESLGSTEVAIYADQPFQEVGRFSSNAGQPVHLALGVAPGSDYFVRVSSGEDDSQYRLVATIDRLPAGFAWEVEDNDTGISANPLDVTIDGLQDIEVRGSSGKEQDHDWFKLHVSDTGNQHPVWMSVSFYRSSVSATSSMEIYSSYPDIADRQIGEISVEPLSNLNSFSGIVERGGDYFIKVDNGDEPVSSDYHFLLSLEEIPADEGMAWEVEPNGLVAWANPLQLSVKQRGNSWDGNEDDDWYVLDTGYLMLDVGTESPAVLNLNFSRPSGIGTTLVELYDTAPVAGNQSPVTQLQVNTASAQKGSINLDIEAGTYYVRVNPQNETSTAEYELVALLVESISLTRFAADGGEIERIGRPLRAGDVIRLSLTWDVGAAQATFDIGDIAADLLMVEQESGIYVGDYTVTADDDEIAAPITAHLLDQFGNTTDIELDETVTVDTTSPAILEIFHDGITPLSAGKKLTVTMVGEPRGRASFDIAGFRTGLDMYSMTSNEADPPLIILGWDWRPDPPFGIIVSGEIKNVSDSTKDRVKINATFYDANDNPVLEDSAFATPRNIPPGVVASFNIHADHVEGVANAKLQLVYGFDGKVVGESADDGVYIGSYEIGDDDNISNAAIVCHLTDSAGNQSSAEAASPVTFDTIPPVINSLIHDADRILVEGDILTVTLEGESGGEATFDIGSFQTGLDMSSVEVGRYVGTYRVRAGDQASGALITGYLKDAAGNEVTYIGVRTVSINTSAPNISAVTHNGIARPFIEGETLTVTVNTDPGVTATFDLVGLTNDRIMHDDGQHDDGDPGDGTYSGSYVIRKGDNVGDGRVAVTVVSPNGKSVLREALETVSVDTELPVSVTGVRAVDKPDDEGGYVIVNWTPSDVEDFDHYNIYQSEQPIISLRGLEPIDELISNIEVSSVEIAVPTPVPGIPAPTFYFAVTAVDVATNESLLTRESTDGPVSGADNLPPEPVGKVTASDRAFDNGKIITISWSDPAVTEDFYRYHIYMDIAPVTSVLGLVPVDASITDRNVLLADIVVPEDGIGFYFAVTAVDFAGNESLVIIDSTVGPVSSEDNLGVAPDTIVKIISGPVGEIHYDDVIFRWNRWFEGQIEGAGLSGYYYKLDNGNWTWTSDTYKTYYDLSEGEHTFYVRADLGPGNTDPMPATRVFAVRRLLLSETEPNDSGGRANWISRGVTVFGTNANDGDDDWYRFHVESGGLMTLYFSRIGGIGSTNITIFNSFPP